MDNFRDIAKFFNLGEDFSFDTFLKEEYPKKWDKGLAPSSSLHNSIVRPNGYLFNWVNSGRIDENISASGDRERIANKLRLKIYDLNPRTYRVPDSVWYVGNRPVLILEFEKLRTEQNLFRRFETGKDKSKELKFSKLIRTYYHSQQQTELVVIIYWRKRSNPAGENFWQKVKKRSNRTIQISRGKGVDPSNIPILVIECIFSEGEKGLKFRKWVKRFLFYGNANIL